MICVTHSQELYEDKHVHKPHKDSILVTQQHNLMNTGSRFSVIPHSFGLCLHVRPRSPSAAGVIVCPAAKSFAKQMPRSWLWEGDTVGQWLQVQRPAVPLQITPTGHACEVWMIAYHWNKHSIWSLRGKTNHNNRIRHQLCFWLEWVRM